MKGYTYGILYFANKIRRVLEVSIKILHPVCLLSLWLRNSLATHTEAFLSLSLALLVKIAPKMRHFCALAAF